MAQIVAAAIIESGRLLAARRCAGRFTGLWEFPGGKIEPGEDDGSALLRELREELGVTGRIGERVGGDWPLAGGHTMRVYRFTLDPGQSPRCLEGCDALQWVGAAEAASLSWIPADLPIVAAVQRMLQAPPTPGA
jgi:8-oxo-dGTP diphosphatase